uniref:PUB domain-containing protein n=1 Tax=Noctiluca scintillans TaxID=2966 RepID=A0A7S1A4P5_NOCSC
MAGEDSQVPRVLVTICRFWDSPVLLIAVWAAALLSSSAVLLQHQHLVDTCSHSAPTRRGLENQVSQNLVVSDSSVGYWDMKKALEGLARDNPKRYRQGFRLLYLMGQNLLQHPEDPKYMRIRKGNPTFVGVFGQLIQHDAGMRALGFVDTETPDVWRFPADEVSWKVLRNALDTLSNALDKEVQT